MICGLAVGVDTNPRHEANLTAVSDVGIEAYHHPFAVLVQHVAAETTFILHIPTGSIQLQRAHGTLMNFVQFLMHFFYNGKF